MFGFDKETYLQMFKSPQYTKLLACGKTQDPRTKKITVEIEGLLKELSIHAAKGAVKPAKGTSEEDIKRERMERSILMFEPLLKLMRISVDKDYQKVLMTKCTQKYVDLRVSEMAKVIASMEAMKDITLKMQKRAAKQKK